MHTGEADYMTTKVKRTEYRQSINLDKETYQHVKEMAHSNGYSVRGIMRSLIRQEHARQAHAHT